MVSLIHEIENRGLKRGLAQLCGVGRVILVEKKDYHKGRKWDRHEWSTELHGLTHSPK